MKPELIKVPASVEHSFNVRHDMIPNINSRWHYHTELELIHFHKGHGMQFVGDNIKPFSAGDTVLIGSNLPHFWKYDETEEAYKADLPYSTVIHFTENFLGDCFLNMPEADTIKTVLKKAKRGMVLQEENAEKIREELNNLLATEGIERIIALLRCLSAFADDDKAKLLSSIGFKYEFAASDSNRINTVFDYTLQHFKSDIPLEKIAAIAGMAVNSFCRYFKTKTGKTYTQFLYEIKVGYACKLLIGNRHSVKQICFESGFNNFTSFYKIFKKITGRTPQQYVAEYKK